MIAPLRRRHRTLITLVGAGSGAVLVAAVAVRQPAPVMRDVPAAILTTPCLPDSSPREVASDAYRDAGLRVELRHQGDSTGLCVRWLEAPRLPSLVAYWAPLPATDNALPDGVIPLGPVGALGDQGFPLPGTSPGYLVIASAPHHRVLLSGPLPAPRAEAP